MDYVTLIGTVGAFIILCGFLLNQAGRLTADSRMYDAINVVGGGLLIVYAVLLGSYPFIVLNAVWVLVSVYGLYKSVRGQ